MVEISNPLNSSVDQFQNFNKKRWNVDSNFAGTPVNKPTSDGWTMHKGE